MKSKLELKKKKKKKRVICSIAILLSSCGRMTHHHTQYSRATLISYSKMVPSESNNAQHSNRLPNKLIINLVVIGVWASIYLSFGTRICQKMLSGFMLFGFVFFVYHGNRISISLIQINCTFILFPTKLFD